MEIISSALEVVLRPFIAALLLAALVGQFMTAVVFTRRRAFAKGRFQPFWWWMRKTLPLHPVIAGVLAGLLWPGDIEAGYIGGTFSGILYFSTAGALSVWGYEVLKGLAKRQGFELSSPSVDEDGPAPPPERDDEPTTSRPLPPRRK